MRQLVDGCVGQAFAHGNIQVSQTIAVVREGHNTCIGYLVAIPQHKIRQALASFRDFLKAEVRHCASTDIKMGQLGQMLRNVK